MDKKIVTQILVENQVDMNNLEVFVKEYVFEKLNKNITADQLVGIISLIQFNQFDLRFAAKQAAAILNLNVLEVFNAQGLLLKTIVYE